LASLPNFNNVTTIIFDMDGTLIEHTWQINRICRELFDGFADQLAPVTYEDFFECYWGKSVDMWYMMVDGVLDGATAARYGYVNTLRALEQNIALAEPMLRRWEELVLVEAVPFADTYPVLKILRSKYTTGILTNGFTYFQRQKINKYKLADYVDFTLVSEEAGCHKPDPQIFDYALKLAGNPAPQQVLYIGDNPDADINGALAAKLTPIFINGKNNGTPPAGVVSIEKLGELLELLNLPGL